MPKKYSIHVRTVPHRFRPITRSGVIAWEEGCLKCPVCVKRTCVYGVYDKRSLDGRQMLDSLDTQCMSCLRCIQGCPKELIQKSVNPRFKGLGDALFTPEIVARIWQQAETGKIPVSGAGYPGPFTGPGFDAMWTDMSEIVRPTRDGIHGREYISTSVDLGKTPTALCFDARGALVGETPQVIDIPLPVLLSVPSFGALGEGTLKGWAMAAMRLESFLWLPEARYGPFLERLTPWLCMVLDRGTDTLPPGGARLVEIPWEEGWEARHGRLAEARPGIRISLRLEAEDGMEEKALEAARKGASLLHLTEPMPDVLDGEGLRRMMGLKDRIRSLHARLLEADIRDTLTVLVSGGLGMAEHVAKAIICGADATVVDFPILIALECRMCRRCTTGDACPVDIQEADAPWVARRVINLIGAWHNQLLEVMGAMGIRDARRLRGETGRAMFFEDLDRSVFGSLGEVSGEDELE